MREDNLLTGITCTFVTRRETEEVAGDSHSPSRIAETEEATGDSRSTSPTPKKAEGVARDNNSASRIRMRPPEIGVRL